MRWLGKVAPGILIAALALTYWQLRMVLAVPSPDRIEQWSADLYESYLPVWTFAYAGPRLVPRWNPFQLAGSPFLASVTGAPAYPLNLLAAIVPVPIALGWACALHVALAGVLMFLCGRAAGLTRAAATLAAIGFMLSERVLVERIHPPYLFGIAWLPAVFLTAGRVVSAPGVWRGAVLGATVGCLLLAGYPELLCFTAYALLLLLLVFLVIRGVPAWSDLRRLMVAGIAAVATASALGAIQLLPTLELAGQAVRSLKSLPLDQILAVSPPPWEGVLLTSGPLVGLALAAFTGRGHLPLLVLGAVLIVFACAVGLVTPFYMLVFRHLPGVALFRQPHAILPIGVFALALLAGLGLDVVTVRSPGRAWAGATVVLASASLMLLAPRVNLRATYPIAVLVVAGVIALLPWSRARAAGAWVVVALFAIERFAQPGSVIMIPQGNAPGFFDPPPLVAFLRGRIGFDRVLVIKDWNNRFPVMEKMGTLFGFRVVQDYEPLTVGAYHEFLRPFEDVNEDHPGFGGRFYPPPYHAGWPRLDLLGVRYVVVAPGWPWRGENTKRFRLVYDAPDGRVYENLDALPRAFLVTRTVVVPDPDAALAHMDAPGFRPLEEAVVGRDVTWQPDSTRVDVPARVVVEEDQPESVGLRVSTPEQALLVVSDLFWPGWSVTVDGEEREIYRVDYLLRGVPVEPGEHTVRFSYAPARVRLGAALTGGTLLMLAMLAIGAVVPRRRRAPRARVTATPS